MDQGLSRAAVPKTDISHCMKVNDMFRDDNHLQTSSSRPMALSSKAAVVTVPAADASSHDDSIYNEEKVTAATDDTTARSKFRRSICTVTSCGGGHEGSGYRWRQMQQVPMTSDSMMIAAGDSICIGNGENSKLQTTGSNCNGKNAK